jgi:uncharacterized protein YrrD
MLRSLTTLFGYTIHENDGDMGHVHDFLFDDTAWRVRYLVIETGKWLHRKRALVSTTALGRPDWSQRKFPVNLTREQVKNSPDLDTDKPVSRQQEIAMNAYYGWPHYWTLEPIFAAPAVAGPVIEHVEGDAHLRSVRDITGYRVAASGGEDLGHVDDFIALEGSWEIHNIVLHCGKWGHGKKVLLTGPQVTAISWARKEIKINASREHLLGAPVFDPAAAVNREQETRLYDYYGRPRGAA